MAENEPNATPAAGADAAGQQPTTTQASATTSTTDAATSMTQASATQGSEPQQQSQSQEQVANPEAKRYADEAAKYRKDLRDAQKRLAELEAKEKAAEDAKLSREQLLEKKLAEAQNTIAQTKLTFRERVLNAEIRAAAREAGVNPALAARLVDLAQVEDDEEGNPKNIADLLTKAIAEYGITPNAANTNTASNATAQNQRQQQTAAAGQAMGATNAQRAAGPLTITPNQYLDPAFRSEFLKTHGTDLLKAVNAGKVKII